MATVVFRPSTTLCAYFFRPEKRYISPALGPRTLLARQSRPESACGILISQMATAGGGRRAVLLIIECHVFGCRFRHNSWIVFWSSAAPVARCSTHQPTDPGAQCRYFDTSLKLR